MGVFRLGMEKNIGTVYHRDSLGTTDYDRDIGGKGMENSMETAQKRTLGP